MELIVPIIRRARKDLSECSAKYIKIIHTEISYVNLHKQITVQIHNRHLEDRLITFIRNTLRVHRDFVEILQFTFSCDFFASEISFPETQFVLYETKHAYIWSPRNRRGNIP